MTDTCRETETIFDPFLRERVEISTKLIDRLNGRYAVGPTMPNGEPEFGWREHEVPPIQKEAAAEIARLRAEIERKDAAIQEACDLLTERRHGNSARSAGHNARLCLESALLTAGD